MEKGGAAATATALFSRCVAHRRATSWRGPRKRTLKRTLQGVEEFGGFDAAGGELGDELFVGGEKIVLGEFARKNPGDLFEGDGLDGVVGDCCGEEADFEGLVTVRIFVLNAPEFD